MSFPRPEEVTGLHQDRTLSDPLNGKHSTYSGYGSMFEVTEVIKAPHTPPHYQSYCPRYLNPRRTEAKLNPQLLFHETVDQSTRTNS